MWEVWLHWWGWNRPSQSQWLNLTTILRGIQSRLSSESVRMDCPADQTLPQKLSKTETWWATCPFPWSQGLWRMLFCLPVLALKSATFVHISRIPLVTLPISILTIDYAVFPSSYILSTAKALFGLTCILSLGSLRPNGARALIYPGSQSQKFTSS